MLSVLSVSITSFQGCNWCRDVNEEEETTPWAEQQTWEAEQIKKASMKVGSKDKRKQEYDLVFEDQIDFITDHIENGNLEVCS